MKYVIQNKLLKILPYYVQNEQQKVHKPNVKVEFLNPTNTFRSTNYSNRKRENKNFWYRGMQGPGDADG